MTSTLDFIRFGAFLAMQNAGVFPLNKGKRSPGAGVLTESPYPAHHRDRLRDQGVRRRTRSNMPLDPVNLSQREPSEAA